MLTMVSPVMVGADAASPQPMTPRRLDADQNIIGARDGFAGHLTGFFIGRLTAMASIALIFTLCLAQVGSRVTRPPRATDEAVAVPQV